MAAIEYLDGYLSALIDKKPEWEERARADVAALGTFPEFWADRLIMVRTYILCCIESLASPDDVFSTKLKWYTEEYKRSLYEARLAVQNPDGGIEIQRPFLSMNVLRA